MSIQIYKIVILKKIPRPFRAGNLGFVQYFVLSASGLRLRGNDGVPDITVLLSLGDHLTALCENDKGRNVGVGPGLREGAVHRSPVNEGSAAYGDLLIVYVTKMITHAQKCLLRVSGILEEAAVDLDKAVDAIDDGGIRVGGDKGTVVNDDLTRVLRIEVSLVIGASEVERTAVSIDSATAFYIFSPTKTPRR